MKDNETNWKKIWRKQLVKEEKTLKNALTTNTKIQFQRDREDITYMNKEEKLLHFKNMIADKKKKKNSIEDSKNKAEEISPQRKTRDRRKKY